MKIFLGSNVSLVGYVGLESGRGPGEGAFNGKGLSVHGRRRFANRCIVSSGRHAGGLVLSQRDTSRGVRTPGGRREV